MISKYEMRKEIAEGAANATWRLMMSVFSSDDSVSITPIKLPEPFKHDFTTIQLLLVDVAPNRESPIWVVRFDGIGWCCWVREPDLYSPYGISLFNQISKSEYKDRPGLELVGIHGNDFIVEFLPYDDSDLTWTQASDWFKKHRDSIGEKYRQHVDTKFIRGIKRLFGWA